MHGLKQSKYHHLKYATSRQQVSAAKWKLAKIIINVEDAFANSYGVETSKILLVKAAKKNEDDDVAATNS